MALGKNIIQLQEELTYMPMQKLVQLVGDPNSEYGSLPLMEIKNRQDLQNASAQAPQSTVADDIISTATTPVGISPPGQTQIANGGISNIPMAMAGGGTVRYNEGGLGDIREMLGVPREGFTQREDYPPIYDDDGNIVGYDTRTKLGKKFADYLNVDSKKELPSAFRNIFTPVTDTGNKAVDNTIGMIMNIPDLFLNTFDGIEGTSKKDSINLARGYPELVHEDSYQFELENFSGKYDKYKDRLKKDGVPSKLYQEGGSVYSNPYFGDADPEEVKKLQEQNPNLSTEDAVAMILGIDTADITTRQGFYGGGVADLIGKTPTIRPIDRYNVEELAEQSKESAEKALAELRAKYGDNIPRDELYGISYLFQDQADYENMLKKYEGRDAAELARRERVISGIKTIPDDLKQKTTDTDSEKKPLTQEEINNLTEEINTSAGILDIAKTRELLGLQSKEELEKDKQALLLLGLGSAIGGAKDLSDITKGVLPVAKELTNMDRAMSKENIALFSALNKNTGQDLFNKDTVALKNISQVIKEMDESGEQGSERYNKAVALRDALLRKLDLQGYLTGSQPTLKISSSNVPSVG